jgi:hypothetical protein
LCRKPGFIGLSQALKNALIGTRQVSGHECTAYGKTHISQEKIGGIHTVEPQCTNGLYQGTTSVVPKSAVICWALAPASVIHHENLQGIFTSMISGNQHQN